MIAFPYDSLITVEEDQTITLDRAIDSKLYRRLLSKYFTTGVFPNPGTGFQVLANEKFITVKAGCANINGIYAELENDQNINVTDYIRSDATVTLAVVIRHNDSYNVRATTIEVLSDIGNNLPVFTRNDTIYDLVVAKVTLEPNTITIHQSDVTDLRMHSEYCGIVSNVIKSIDTTTFYNQIQDDLLQFKNEEQAEFIEWFETIKNIMDENVAGNLKKEIGEIADNLQNQINNIWDKIYPIGAIYISVNNIDPKILFGGTWVRLGNGRVPIGVDTSDSNFDAVEKLGGAKEHDLRALIGAVENDSGSIGYYAEPPIRNMPRYVMRVNGTAMAQGNYSANHTTLVRMTDGNYASTIQPYITCYMWKRTA